MVERGSEAPMISFLPLLLSVITSVEYKGQALDLAHSARFSLYRGEERVHIADDLSIQDVEQIAAQSPDLWWLETRILIPKSFRDETDIWFFLKTDVEESQIFINRHLILSNGQPGASGRYIATAHIPRNHIKTGDAGRMENHIRIRFSNTRFQSGTRFFSLSIGPPDVFKQRTDPHVYGPLFLCGVFLLAACIYLAFFFGFEKQTIFLVLSILFLCCFWTMAEQVIMNKLIPPVSYRHHFYFGRWLDYTALTLLVYSLTHAFRIELRKNRLPVLCFVLVLFFVSMRWVDVTFLSVFAVGIAIWAWGQDKPNARLIALSLVVHLILLLLDETNLLDDAVANANPVLKSFVYYLDYAGFALFSMVMLVVGARDIILARRREQAARLKSISLENELMRKHIQPHFLMNSLMALQQLIDTDQKTASHMVEALSEEFHLLTLASREPLIDSQTEIELCRIHLKIMSMQQRAKYRLETEGLDGTETIPPAIFHTLIENGLTHGFAGRSDGLFQLSKRHTPDGLIYTLSNNGCSDPSASKESTGSGLAYVRGRLEESFPGRWHLTSEPIENGWQTVITIKDAS